MAYYKQYGKFVATYESCSTAAFKHGRTETMRPATMYTKQAVEMICKQNITASQLELGKALMNCSDLHNKLTKDAAMGNIYITFKWNCLRITSVVLTLLVYICHSRNVLKRKTKPLIDQ